MIGLAHKWVFDPFRLLLDDSSIDLFIVHIGGLLFDLSEGFLLVFDKTRPLGIFLGAMFHGMNSQMFHIGMFPYTMIATLPLFCSTDWPKKLFSSLPNIRGLPTTEKPQISPHCIYPELANIDEKRDKRRNGTERSHQPSLQHKALVLTVVLYISTQMFLPYSHFITKVHCKILILMYKSICVHVKTS